jgi:orotidine-5'-phosphate decarboxylase
MTVSSPVIVALDFPRREPALALASQLDPARCRVKVGKELFTAEGPAIVEALHQQGFDVFLDLKFHDIPATVAKACRSAAELGVWMVNVHASGGRSMMEAALESVSNASHRPIMTAVTVLTSMSADDLREIGIQREPKDQVLHLAQLAKDSGMDGVVCSAQEAEMLRAQLAQPFTLVTPGIRPANSDANDQHRIVTPSDAMAKGVDYLVIGRPITAHAEPLQSLNNIIDEIDNA